MKKVCCLLLSLALLLSCSACSSRTDGCKCYQNCACNIDTDTSEAPSDVNTSEPASKPETSINFETSDKSTSTQMPSDVPRLTYSISEEGEILKSVNRYNSKSGIEYIISYPQNSQKPLADMKVYVNSTNSAVIANIFKDLCDTGYCKDGAWTYHCRGKEVSILSGEIFIDGVNSGVKTAKRTLYDEVKAMYLTGEWNGTSTKLMDHEISLSKTNGYILVDGYISVSQHCLDLPEDINYDEMDSLGTYYLFGEGAYAIIDQKLTKFVRGEQVELSGGKLYWKGRENDAEVGLYYCEQHDLLFLTAFTDYYYNVYVFPDRNVSKMKYIGKVLSETALYYSDIFEVDISNINPHDFLNPAWACTLALR